MHVLKNGQNIVTRCRLTTGWVVNFHDPPSGGLTSDFAAPVSIRPSPAAFAVAFASLWLARLTGRERNVKHRRALRPTARPVQFHLAKDRFIQQNAVSSSKVPFHPAKGRFIQQSA